MGNHNSVILRTKKNIIINDIDSDLNKENYHDYIKNTNSYTGFPVVDCGLDKEYQHHEMLLKIWGSNFYSPVESILKRGDAKVLDVGCGFGAWIYDMTKYYPLSHFTGIDIIIPKDDIQSNVSFTKADVLERLQYSDCSFDYIHIRDLLLFIKTKDTNNKLFPDLIRILKPDGWIESMEYLGFVNTGPNTKILLEILNSYFRNHGICIEDFANSITKLFKEYNLEYQVEERTVYLKDCDLIKRKFITMFRVLKSMILEYSGISNEKYDEMLDKTDVELTEYKTAFQLIRHFGKKLSV